MQHLDVGALARQLILTLVPMVLSLTVHEYAHAAVATALGDRTARQSGRLTLDPRAHVDPWGTLIIPALSVVLGGMAFIGWAKPVSCRPDRFRKGVPPRLGLALVAVAGPLSNLALAFAAAGGLAAAIRFHVPLAAERGPNALAMLLTATFSLNVGLALFNLLPFPPLDGHRLLPSFLDPIVKPLERYGFAILMIVFLMLPSVATVIFYKPLRLVQALIASLFGL